MTDINKPIKDDTKESEEERSTNESAEQKIFEEKITSYMEEFGQKCAENNIPSAVTIAMPPEYDTPIVYIRGEMFDAARVLAFVLRRMKDHINQELDV